MLNKKTLSLTLAVIVVALAVIMLSVIIWDNRIKTIENNQITAFIDKKQTITEEPQKKITIPESEIINPEIIYLKGDEIILYNFTNSEKKIILKSEKLIDYNVSEDKKFIVYSLKEDGFEGNSDIYIKNIDTDETTRLTENNNIASINPVIFPSNDKIAYVRRTYDPKTKKLSDGEIWVINSGGDEKGSKKLIDGDSKNKFALSESDKVIDENGNWTGDYYCISQEESDSVKIGINRISPDGDGLAYWKLDWAGECSGTIKAPFIANIDGSDFFTEKFKQQNFFKDKYTEKGDWKLSNLFWLKDGSFIISNWNQPPVAHKSICYYDREQNKKYTIYDDVLRDKRDIDFALFKDVKHLPDNEIAILYEYHSNKDNDPTAKYLLQKFKINEIITIDKLASGTLIAESDNSYELSLINDTEIISNEVIVYKKKNRNEKSTIYIFDLANKIEEKLDDLN